VSRGSWWMRAVIQAAIRQGGGGADSSAIDDDDNAAGRRLGADPRRQGSTRHPLVVCLRYDMAAPAASRTAARGVVVVADSSAIASSSALRSIRPEHHIHRRISQTDH
jgi:hypothetical protein